MHVVTHGLTSHRSTVAYGGALERCYVHRPAQVFIQARDAAGQNCRVGGDDFRVRLRGPIKDLHASVRDVGDGTHVAEFTAPVSGEFSLLVTLDGRHIDGSPFTIYVGTGSAHAPSCVLLECSGADLLPPSGSAAAPTARQPLLRPRPPLVAGIESCFLIEARDDKGGRITHGGEHMQAWLRPTADAQPAAAASLVGGPAARAAPELAIDDRGDGCYVLRARVFVVGRYELLLHGTRAEEPIGGSPVDVEVVPNAPHALATTLHPFETAPNPLDDASAPPRPHGTPFPPTAAGEEAAFLLVAHDAYGNPCGAGGARFELTLLRATSTDARDDYHVATDLVDLGDGRYRGSFRAGRAGEVLLRIALDGAPIGPCSSVPIVAGPTHAGCCVLHVARGSLDAQASPPRSSSSLGRPAPHPPLAPLTPPRCPPPSASLDARRRAPRIGPLFTPTPAAASWSATAGFPRCPRTLCRG